MHISLWRGLVRATLAACLLLAATLASAQAPQPTTPDTVLRVRKVSPAWSHFGGRVVVTVDNLHNVGRDVTRPLDSLKVYVNGYAIPDSRPIRVGPGNEVSFKLTFTKASQDAWTAVLADSSTRGRDVRIGVGFPGGPEAQPAARAAILRFERFTPRRLYLSMLGYAVALLAFVAMVLRSGVLRDSAEESGRPVHERPFSLGRAQAAAWFFAIVAGFLYIRLVTDDYTSLTPQALLLLGIGTATQAASGLVDNTLRKKARATLAEMRPRLARVRAEVREMKALRSSDGEPAALAQLRAQLAVSRVERDDAAREVARAKAVLTGLPTRGILVDLVSDGQGVSLHRFQMAVWTVILIGIYLTEVVTTWAMPQFNGEMLALMGFSGGAFVGFKMVERQPVQSSAPPSAEPPADAPPAEPQEQITPQVFKVISDLEPAATSADTRGTDAGIDPETPLAPR